MTPTLTGSQLAWLERVPSSARDWDADTLANVADALPSLLAAARENARLRELLRPRGIEELEAENHSWMTREDALSHYLCAQANWNIVLDELPQLKADLRATRRELARARAKGLRHFIESVRWGHDFADSERPRVERLLQHYARKFEAEAERSE